MPVVLVGPLSEQLAAAAPAPIEKTNVRRCRKRWLFEVIEVSCPRCSNHETQCRGDMLIDLSFARLNGSASDGAKPLLSTIYVLPMYSGFLPAINARTPWGSKAALTLDRTEG